MTRESGPSTLANIDEAGRSRRRLSGIVLFIVALLVSWVVVFVKLDEGWWAYAPLIVFPLYAGAASGLLQASAGICVARAAKGEREEAGCGIPIDNAETVSHFRRIGRKIRLQSIAFGLAATLAVWFLASIVDTASATGP